MKLLLDFSQGLPAPAAIKAAGYSGVVCYLPKDPSGGSTSVHGITAGYYQIAIAAGLDVNLVYEAVDRKRPFLGYSAGVHDGQYVKSQIAALGIPARNVYMAHDIWEPYTTAQVQASRDYQRGAHDVLGDLSGAYAFAWFLKLLMADETANKLWLTGSASSKFAGLHLYQRNYGQVTVGGIQCDVNEVLADDYGQLPNPNPTPPAGTPTQPDEENTVIVYHRQTSDLYILSTGGALVVIRHGDPTVGSLKDAGAKFVLVDDDTYNAMKAAAK